MNNLVLRPTPGPWRLGINFVVGALAVTFLMLCVYGIDDQPPSDTAVLALGLGSIGFLGVLTALAVRRHFAANLRLTDEGFEIGKRKVAWTDVEGFGPAAARFVKVIYARGCEPPGRAAKTTEVLGRLGVYLPPSYLNARYDTRAQGQDLLRILQQWRSRYYAGGRESADVRIDVAADSPGG
jgi:hypothetical protein